MMTALKQHTTQMTDRMKAELLARVVGNLVKLMRAYGMSVVFGWEWPEERVAYRVNGSNLTP